MLTKDLLRVLRAGGDYHLQFADQGDRPLTAKATGVFQRHVGDARTTLGDAFASLEAEADDFKFARGFTSLLDHEAVFEAAAPLPPVHTRRATSEAAMSVGGVATEEERAAMLDHTASSPGLSSTGVNGSLTANREVEQVFSGFDPRRTPGELFAQCNPPLAQTALFDATKVQIQSSDPKAAISTVKRLRLMCEIRRIDVGCEVVVTGSDVLFQRTKRHGTAFARLFRSAATAGDWRLAVTIDDHGTEHEMTFTSNDMSVPGVEPVTEPGSDSGIEADPAARFRGLNLSWSLVQESEPLETGTSAMALDFVFDYAHADSRVFFEIMGFRTPEYVEKELGQLADTEDVKLVVTMDESLGVGEDIATHDHRAIPYTGPVHAENVVDVLRDYEPDLIVDVASLLPVELILDGDVVTLSDLAAACGVSVDVLDDVALPEHKLVGQTLARPVVLDVLTGEIEAGLSLSAAESTPDDRGLDDASAVFSRLGYRVEQEGLTGGMVREK